jgi:biotin-[acetyl-CoA-carboxylase] ligase BirA-like protein
MVSSVPGGDASFTPPGLLDAVAGTRFHDVRWRPETGSTNADLLALAADGAPEGVVLVADHQTAGRGRLGRVWSAPPGASILLSVLLRPDVGLDHAHALTTAVALSAVEACATVAGVRPGLKWPNDLVVAVPAAGGAERKLAGVLAESTLSGHRFAAVVVGIGINVNWPDELPTEIADVAVALNHLTGAPVDRNDLVAAFLTGLDRRYASLLLPGGRPGPRGPGGAQPRPARGHRAGLRARRGVAPRGRHGRGRRPRRRRRPRTPWLLLRRSGFAIRCVVAAARLRRSS